MSCRDVPDRFMDEIGTSKISRCAHVLSGHCRLSGSYNRNAQSKHYGFGALGTDSPSGESKIVAAKPLRTWAHDELKESVPREAPSSREGPGAILADAGFGLGRF